MKNLPYPQLVAGGELTPDEWLSLQDEILRRISRANNVIAGIMLYTARKDWDYACWELSTGYELLTDAEYAQGGLVTISTYLSQIIQDMPEVDNNLNQIFEKSGLQALRDYVGITYHDLEIAIDRLKKFA
jgi:hypothetical protein|nr:MAG TPA: hypothetical protein [Caudoviricetes sp.]